MWTPGGSRERSCSRVTVDDRLCGKGERENNRVKAGLQPHLMPSPAVPDPARSLPSAHLGTPSILPSQEQFLQEGPVITLSENTDSRGFQSSISVQLQRRPAGGQGLASAVNMQWLCFSNPRSGHITGVHTESKGQILSIEFVLGNLILSQIFWPWV